MYYLKVTDAEDSETIEIPSEDDGTLSLSSLSAQYTGATGLKYKVDGHARLVKIKDDKLYPPEGGWGDLTYYCVFPKIATKRKAEDNGDDSDPKSARTSDSEWVSTDLVVLGLPWKTTDKELSDYFGKFGELQLCQVKVDPITKKSKGYGFIRYKDQETQVRVMLQRHQVDGRWCDVRIPVSRDGTSKKSPCKVFVGQCTEDMTEDVLRDHFSKFGKISDLYVPKPFRGFAFVTFFDPSSAKTVCAQDHVIKDQRVFITEAVPKTDKKPERSRGYGGGGGGGGGGGRRSSRRDEYSSSSNSNFYDDYDSRRIWSRDDWKGGWADESPYGRRGGNGGGGDSRKRGSSWTRPSRQALRGGGDSHDNGNFDPNVVAAVVNKAVLGVIGNLKGSQPPPPPPDAANGEWWSRR